MKRVELTESIKRAIETKCGSGVDYDKIAVYQCRANSDEPVKQNSIYNGAVLSVGALEDMARMINDVNKNVAIQPMHVTFHDDILLGRAIKAEVKAEVDKGTHGLYVLFVVSTEHQDYINKIDNGLIDEVSSGFKVGKALCSECGHDLTNADMDFYFTQTCPECEAVMGQNGAHMRLVSVEDMTELSLVTRGAAKNPKILDSLYQVAMSANTPTKNPKFKELKNKHKSEENEMTQLTKETLDEALKPLLEKVSLLEEAVKSTSAPQEPAPEGEPKTDEASAEKVQELEQKLEESATEIDEANAKAAEAEEKLASAEEERDAAVSAFCEEVRKVGVALGKSEAEIPSDFEGAKAFLEASKVTLAANIPVGGVSKGAQLNGQEQNSKLELSCYKVKK